MKIHCLYRDFFIFLKMMNLARDKWQAFKRYYFEKHRDFLSAVWFSYQGYTVKNIRERVRMINKGDYADLESQLKLYDIEENTRQAIIHSRSLLLHPGLCEVYIYIGFFSPDSFVIPYGNSYVICVGLERFHSFRYYPILLSHEFCHFIQNSINGNGEDNLISRLVREGISVYFSKIAYPGKKDYTYFFLKAGTYNFLNSHYRDILKKIHEGEFNSCDLFYGNTGDLPPRSGYYLGYRIVLDFIEKTGERSIDYLIKNFHSIVMDVRGN